MFKAKESKQSKEPVTLEAIANLMDDRLGKLESKLTAKLSTFDEILKTFDAKLQALTLESQKQQASILVLEEAARKRDRIIETLQEQQTSTSQQIDRYKSKVTDLEKRSRRQNLWLIGIPEKFENGDLTVFFSKFLMDVFGSEVLDSSPIIDRAHRISRFHSDSSLKPRQVILRIHYPHTKERLIRAARKKGRISIQDFKFHILEDHSPEVLRARLAFKLVMSEIHQKGYKQALLFPAHLRVTLEDGTYRLLKSPADAQSFLEE